MSDAWSKDDCSRGCPRRKFEICRKINARNACLAWYDQRAVERMNATRVLK